MRKKTVLVTGGAGFIGSHMVDRLIQNKFQVIILDNFRTGNKSYVNSAAKLIEGDVRDNDCVEQVFSPHTIDIVFHIAGQASPITSFLDPELDVAINLNGTMNITLACTKYRVPRLLFASSMTEYGKTDLLPIGENQQCLPISYYGIAKYAAERFVHATAERIDLVTPLHVTSFRMFNVYGPRQSLENPYQGALAIFIGNVLRDEAITIYGDGTQSRDFIYITDVVDVWIKAIENKKSFGQVFNVGLGKKISINSLVRHIITTLKKNPKRYPITYKEGRPGEQRHMQSDITKAIKLLGFKPRITLNQGLKRTIAWAKSI